MVFDYAEHDLTGMVDAVKTTTGLSPAQVRPLAALATYQPQLRGISARWVDDSHGGYS
jgi:hypothetical protein